MLRGACGGNGVVHAICDRLEIPAAPAGRLDDLPDDPHLVATAFFTQIEDSRMGRVRFPGVAVKFNGTRPEVRMPPRLGEHTRQALLAAGLPAAQVEALIATGAARATKETT